MTSQKIRFLCALIVIFVNSLSGLELPIYVIGDSHSGEFNQIQGCHVKHIGPITMHRVGRDGLNIVDLRRMGVTENHMVVFCFGEIDVRCHVLKQKEILNKSVDEVLDALVTTYIHTILLNKKYIEGLIPVIYSVTPPTDADFNPNYPFYGLLSERVTATKLLNDKLKNICATNQIDFIDVYDDYADENGALIYKYSDGTVHINSYYNGPIIQKLYTIFGSYH